MAGFNAIWNKHAWWGRAAVLTYTMPVWATIFASIFGYEKINISIIVSLIFGIVGIFFLSLEIDIFENFIGFLITLSAGLSWAIGTMIVKYGGIRSDGLIVAGATNDWNNPYYTFCIIF